MDDRPNNEVAGGVKDSAARVVGDSDSVTSRVRVDSMLWQTEDLFDSCQVMTGTRPTAPPRVPVAAAADSIAPARSPKLEEGSAVTGGAGGGGRTCCGFVELGCGWWLEGFRFRLDVPSVEEQVGFLRFFASDSDTTGAW